MGLGVAGCVDTAPLTPANLQAQAIGTPILHFTRGVGGGFMKITMPDGENLPGTFSVSESAASLKRAGGPGNFSATARGPKTSLDCHGDLVAGHGTADCRSQTGAVFAAQL